VKSIARSKQSGRRSCGSVPTGFSLVEVTIAIGLFAFVVVGIIGLFPAALAQRADAARETRARLIAEQIIQGLRASTELWETPGDFFLPPLVEMGEDDTSEVGQLKRQGKNNFPFSLGYGEIGTAAVRVIQGRALWDGGITGGDETDVVFIALVEREADPSLPTLHNITVQVGFPASLPADKRRNETFATKVYLP
jgi:type II secretory pathway pseudopilin PulG